MQYLLFFLLFSIFSILWIIQFATFCVIQETNANTENNEYLNRYLTNKNFCLIGSNNEILTTDSFADHNAISDLPGITSKYYIFNIHTGKKFRILCWTKEHKVIKNKFKELSAAKNNV